nr:hypothetical protein BOSE7B_40080 [Bosea sp. 7B]
MAFASRSTRWLAATKRLKKPFGGSPRRFGRSSPQASDDGFANFRTQPRAKHGENADRARKRIKNAP